MYFVFVLGEKTDPSITEAQKGNTEFLRRDMNFRVAWRQKVEETDGLGVFCFTDSRLSFEVKETELAQAPIKGFW